MPRRASLASLPVFAKYCCSFANTTKASDCVCPTPTGHDLISRPEHYMIPSWSKQDWVFFADASSSIRKQDAEE